MSDPSTGAPLAIGLDLAWGDRARTGVAVLDDAGHLRHLGTASDDASVTEAVAGWLDRPCTVAIDAPLVVTNATGRRPCEAALAADFARFDAGPHPSNLSRPYFVPEPRGGRLARTWGLELDTGAGAGAPRRAVEVYPHAATIALFGLGRILRYKHKPGRDLLLLRAELTRLLDLLESLADAEVPLVLDHPEWRRVRETMGAATTKAGLRRVEDEVDAVVCAYVARLERHVPERLTRYGDAATGVIVTPTLPPGLVPSRR